LSGSGVWLQLTIKNRADKIIKLNVNLIFILFNV